MISAIYTHTENYIKSGVACLVSSRYSLYRLGNRGDSGKTDCGISLEETMMTDLDFTDEVVIFVERLKVLLPGHTELGARAPWTKSLLD